MIPLKHRCPSLYPELTLNKAKLHLQVESALYKISKALQTQLVNLIGYEEEMQPATCIKVNK